LSQVNQLSGLSQKSCVARPAKEELVYIKPNDLCCSERRETVDLAQSPVPPLWNWNVPKVAATFDLAIGRGPSMPKIIDILLGEHQASKKLLLVLACERTILR
jgi:hypothetical protein